MGVIRIKKQNNYVVMNKTSLHDDRLSWKAKGLHAYMLSLPDDWAFYDEELSKHAKDGIDALKSAIKELKKFGYMERIKRRDEHGKFVFETNVYELPTVENPLVDNPVVDFPLVENPQLLNNKELCIDVLEKEEEEKPKKESQNPFSFFQENIGQITGYTADVLGQYIDDIDRIGGNGNEVVTEAIKVAIENGGRNLGYIKTILNDWLNRNVKSLSDVKALKKEHEQKKAPKRVGKGQRANKLDEGGLNLDD